ncbi:GM15592 [Drosophila sechellia]|uniref:GM15592 n=1 Tax=Drosophila sechellia TaxID=7238 RepID=B4I8F0_DROSE|nr:GM15592 [Drosophila sechellia]
MQPPSAVDQPEEDADEVEDGNATVHLRAGSTFECRLEWQEEMELELELVLVLVLELEQWLFGAAGRQVMCNL